MRLRNRPCGCGSGRTARECCGRFHRPSDTDAARAHLRRQARIARELLAPFPPSGLAGLRREVAGLAHVHRALSTATLRCPDTSKLVAACVRNGRSPAELLRRALSRSDLALPRVALAKAVMALREEGAVDDYLAAAALVDLDAASSELLAASIAVATETARTGEPVGAGRSAHGSNAGFAAHA